MIDQDLIDYYVNLLIRQYACKPKAQAHVAALVKEAVADQIISRVAASFDLETATGAQLDILGKYKGIRRFFSEADLGRTYLGMPPYDDADPGSYPGMATYAGSIPAGFFAVYNEPVVSYLLNDDEMRRLIKWKILVDKTDGSLKDIDAMFAAIFQTQCMPTDNGDMTMTYAFTVAGVDTLPAIVVALGILPKPAGVSLTITGI